MQFRRESAWMNLNGKWDFAFDPGRSGLGRGLPAGDPKAFPRKIAVPFCPESKLSGIADTDFHDAVWYRREVVFPAAWAGKRVFLNFGAVDWACTLWIDGERAGAHEGGSAPFSVDVTHFAKPGEKQVLVLSVSDDTRSNRQGTGKQSHRYGSFGCHYTRVTGIWQTVWAEAVHPQGLLSCRTTPNLDLSEVSLEPRFVSVAAGDRFVAAVKADGRVVASRVVPASQGLPVSVAIPGVREWSPSDPFLYDLELSVVRDGVEIDRVESYFAMRKVACEGGRVMLNGKPVFLRFVLDQGFYPDGVWTAPSDAELKADIERSMAAGFNGARLHQKVFEDRWHWWADRIGYLTWAEYPSWGFDAGDPAAHRNVASDWAASVVALRNHPSIIGWSPLNETSQHNEMAGLRDGCVAMDKNGHPKLEEYRKFLSGLVALTRSLDPTRPVNDSSGWIHVDTDLWTVHRYVASPKEQKAWLEPEDGPRPVASNATDVEPPYDGQPYVLDEWGGFKYLLPEDRNGDTGWGYNGLDLTDEGDFLGRIKALTALFARLKSLAGWCYTQLTDVEQEQNGVYTYDRRPKADPAKFAAVFGIRPKWSRW